MKKLNTVFAIAFLIFTPIRTYCQFNYNDFSSINGLNLVVNAAQIENKLRIAPASNNQMGAVWYQIKQDISNGFETNFQFQLTAQGMGGADGFAFVIQNFDDAAIGGWGGGIGYHEIPNSLAVEFDTYPNSPHGDPSGNHISIHTRGLLPNSVNHTYSLGSTSNIPNLENGTVYNCKINYENNLLKIYLNDFINPVLTVDVNIADSLNLDNGKAWVGITAATGLSRQNHDILSWSFEPLQPILQLRFPFLNETPSSATISSILDHVNSPYRKDKTLPFVDFLNERAGGIDNMKEWDQSPKYPSLWYATEKNRNDPYLLGYNYNDDKLWYLGHPGYDYAFVYGTDIYAVAPGKVSYPNGNGNTGQKYATLEIDHRETPGTGSGYISYFLHLSTHPNYLQQGTNPPIAQEGDIITQTQVDAGLIIARVGSTSGGKRGGTGIHLHYELHWVNEQGKHIIVDPYGWYPNDGSTDPDPLLTNSYNNGGDDRPESDRGKWLWLDPRPTLDNNIPNFNYVNAKDLFDFQNDASLLWEQKNSNTTQALFDVDFPSSTTGYAIGAEGTIIKTTNSGDQWETILTAPKKKYYAVSFTSELNGTVVGKNMIMQTNDSGDTWNNRWLIPSQATLFDTVNNALFLQDIFFTSQNIGYISGAYLNSQNVSPVFFKTTDSGLTWTYIADYFATGDYDEKYIQSSYFLNDSTGFVNLYSIMYPQNDSTSVIESIQILKTIDGGFSWYEGIEGSLSDYCSDIMFINRDTGYVFGSGVLFKTTNGSANIPSWTSDSLFPGTIKGLGKFSDGLIGVGLNGNIIFSQDGNSWWIEDSGTLNNLFSISSRSGVVCAVGDSGTILIRKSASSLSVSIEHGWNIVSIPGLHPSDQDVNTWWAGLTGSVFKYSGGYVVVTTATPSEGYWMKHSGANVYNTGDEWPASGIIIVPNDPISASAGWNMIGGYENSAATSGLTTNPPGLISGSVFGYSGGYQVAADLVPGYGYWIKLTGAGVINIPGALSKSSSEVVEYFKEDWGKIIIIDNAGRSYTLYAVNGKVNLDNYELPPVPPEGMFDIRYGSGRIAEDINSNIQSIEMSGIEHPVRVTVENMSITLQDETGKAINVELEPGEEITINNNSINKLLINSGEIVAPIEYALEQNYPNPFNPNTVIKFSIPKEVQVNLSIFNILGERVKELKNESMKPGYYEVEFDASSLASGIYLYRIKAGDFVETKKMVLIK